MSKLTDKITEGQNSQNINLVQAFFKLRELLYEYFGFKEDWVIYAFEDYTDYYWQIIGEEDDGEVHYAETIPDLLDKEAGHYYCNDIYTQRFYPKWVYRGEEYTMIFCDTHVDGNKFFGIYKNSLEIKDEAPEAELSM